MVAKHFLLAAGASWMALLVCPPAFGQGSGTISGSVTDSSGGAVAGVKITITAPATGSSRDARTDNAGHYVVPLLGVATYTVLTEVKGFRSEEAQNVVLQTNEQRELDFKLSPATVQQGVEVTAAPVAVETSNPTLGAVITSQ
ncbi:MAG TPA: carboxypeptidase-like regulatory domain-containing protein [Bryobacteraceae bacterium]|nr:carboxypeptidase-like regulatory domain-containing protein [Bryobacteraceae bacterium]